MTIHTSQGATTRNDSSICSTVFCTLLWSGCYTIFTVLPETQKLHLPAISHWSLYTEKKNRKTYFWDDPRRYDVRTYFWIGLCEQHNIFSEKVALYNFLWKKNLTTSPQPRRIHLLMSAFRQISNLDHIYISILFTYRFFSITMVYSPQVSPWIMENLALQYPSTKCVSSVTISPS